MEFKNHQSACTDLPHRAFRSTCIQNPEDFRGKAHLLGPFSTIRGNVTQVLTADTFSKKKKRKRKEKENSEYRKTTKEKNNHLGILVAESNVTLHVILRI